jgi:hypothetical protein
MLTRLPNALALKCGRSGSTHRTVAAPATDGLAGTRKHPTRPRVLIRKINGRRHAISGRRHRCRSLESASQTHASTKHTGGFDAVSTLQRRGPILPAETARTERRITRDAGQLARRASQWSTITCRAFGRACGIGIKQFGGAAVVARSSRRRAARALFDQGKRPSIGWGIDTDVIDGAVGICAIGVSIGVVVNAIEAILGVGRAATASATNRTR